MSRAFAVDLTAVWLAVTDDEPRVLVIDRGDDPALPNGPLEAEAHRTLERGLRSWVSEQTGLELGYVEQLYTFGDRDRAASPDRRLVSVVYLALGREQPVPLPGAAWKSIYEFLPWEDWRDGEPAGLARHLKPGLERWRLSDRPGGEAGRCAVAFGLDGAPWDTERVLERFELLYEAGLVGPGSIAGRAAGRLMALDHRRMLATALGRVRGKIRYRPVIFELLPETFTLFQLQRAAEALAGSRLHKQNFRRLVQRGGLVEGTGTHDSHTGGRPAELFRFRPEVVRERPAPGVGLPAASAR